MEPATKRARISNVTGEAARTSQACMSCRERKIKCCGNQPCRYCSKKQLVCDFPDTVRKKFYSVKYVEDLERRLSTIQDRNSSYGLEPVVVPVESDTTDIEPTSMTSPLIPESAMSSSINFGSRIRNLPAGSTVASHASSGLVYESPDNVYNLEPDRSPHQTRSDATHWPSEEEAHDLLNTVLASIGSLQHLIDPRSFSDRLQNFYEKERDRSIMKDLSYVQTLMVFALGGLLQGKLREGSLFPGDQYFLEAVNFLPSLCTLRNEGTLAVETMGLFSFFLQCSDRKEDAYVHAGLALRLAISMGLGRDDGKQSMKRSERTHRNRLWWTIYMQERRLAAATGNPVGIVDDNIITGLPAESAGFPPIAALNTNIKLARLTGDIIQNVYNPRKIPERQFLSTVHELISKLGALRREWPLEYALDFSKSISVTRTSATLYLMLFQAMILTTRPILLHLARSKLEGKDNENLLSTRSPLQKLTATCVEAAGRSLDILYALKQQSLLAKFGFFDLDASVSSAFVFVLVETIYVEAGSGLQGIKGAIEILQYLSKNGNKAAEKRMLDVKEMCQHLGIISQTFFSPTTTESHPARETEPDNNPLRAQGAAHILSDRNHLTSLHTPACESEDLSGSHPEWRQAFAFPQDYNNSFDDLPLGDDFNQNVSTFEDINGVDFSFNLSHDFVLTGADETDWEEFERQIARLQ
ncbi:fungal-specific transcription factor domain-containing protein [Dendryphion nanum]|uniref:Fungal-specific transcription factor domain-containing protein n=1 Tax=Dendryphion nanum TaxID=256645 RepID=A0A9P9IYG9_9PLEO|nr:fungal-specific transcription factor domain-containing protein [Dendryphion nanum]